MSVNSVFSVLSTKDVAKRLGLSPQAITKAVRAGRLRHSVGHEGFYWPMVRDEFYRNTDPAKLRPKERAARGLPVRAPVGVPDVVGDRCAGCSDPSKIRGLCQPCYALGLRAGLIAKVVRGPTARKIRSESPKCRSCHERRPKAQFSFAERTCDVCVRSHEALAEERTRLRGVIGRSSACYCVACDTIGRIVAQDMCRACYSAFYRSENSERVKVARKRLRDGLSETYVRNKLGLTKEVAPPELIEAKRVQLQIHRLATEHTP